MKILQIRTNEPTIDPVSSTPRNGFSSVRYDLSFHEELPVVVVRAKDSRDGKVTLVPLHNVAGIEAQEKAPGETLAADAPKVTATWSDGRVTSHVLGPDELEERASDAEASARRASARVKR